MKTSKVISCIIAASVMVNLFSGCRQPSENKEIKIDKNTPEQEKVIENPFTFDTPTDEAAIKYYTGVDSFDIIVLGGPYYMGAQHLDQPAYQEFDKLLKDKIDEAIDLTNELFNKGIMLKKEMEKLKRDYIDMWDVALPEAKELKDAAKEIASFIIEYQIREEALVAGYNSIQIEPSDDPITIAFFENQKTGLAIEFANVLSEDFSYLLSSAIQVQMTFEDADSPAIKEAAKIFDEKLDAIQNIAKKLDEVQTEFFKLDMALKQINTGQYYLGLASSAFIEEQMPALLDGLDSFSPNELVTQEDINFMKEYGEFMGNFGSEIQTTLENTDKSYLIDLDSLEVAYEYESTFADLFYSRAYGKNERGYMESALRSLKFKAQRLSNAISIGADMTKAGLKTGWKEGKRTIGVLADTANVIIKSGADYIAGKANGLSMKKIKEQWGDNIYEAGKNYEKYKSGAQVFKTSEEFFDWLETQGGNATAAPIEKTWGKGNISWIAGQMGKCTVNMFTGFGKGVTKILNPDSSKGAIAEGMLDVGLSFVGGSLVIFKGSQTISGAKESLKQLGQRGLNFLGKVITDSNIQNLKNLSTAIRANAKLTPEMLEKLYENAMRIDSQECLRNKIIQASKNLNDEFLKLLNEGTQTFASNVVGAKETYKNFVEKAFKNSLSGYKEALQAVLGESYKDYINNLVANKADDLFKTIVKDYINKGLIPGLGCPFDGNYKGSLTTNLISLPVEIAIENGSLGVIVDYKKNDNKESIIFTMKGKGSVDESGIVTANVDMYSSIKAEIKIDGEPTGQKIEGSGTVKEGSLTGKIEESQMIISINGTENTSENVMGRIENKTGPMKTINMTLEVEEE